MSENTSVKENKFAITTRTGETIVLDKATVQNYLAGGQEITNSEFTMFFQLCKVHKVNPFLKEAYIIKFGGSPATIVLDYKVLQQCAEDNPKFQGMATGLLVVDSDGNEKERKGSYLLPNENLIAGWCEVLRSDRKEPTKVYAMFDEFKQINKKTGELNSNWGGKPCFMITKVAKAQALREAFPNMFGSNIYIQEEADMMDKQSANKDFINTSVEEVNKKVEQHLDDNSEELNSAFETYNNNDEDNRVVESNPDLYND